MATIIKGNKFDRVVQGALLGAAGQGLRALAEGKPIRLALAAGALAGGTAQANHRLKARAAASERNERLAAQLIDAVDQLIKLQAGPAIGPSAPAPAPAPALGAASSSAAR